MRVVRRDAHAVDALSKRYGNLTKRGAARLPFLSSKSEARITVWASSRPPAVEGRVPYLVWRLCVGLEGCVCLRFAGRDRLIAGLEVFEPANRVALVGNDLCLPHQGDRHGAHEQEANEAVLLVLFSFRSRQGSGDSSLSTEKLSNRTATQRTFCIAAHPAENTYFVANRGVLLVGREKSAMQSCQPSSSFLSPVTISSDGRQQLLPNVMGKEADFASS